jgi:aminopeptidase N
MHNSKIVKIYCLLLYFVVFNSLVALTQALGPTVKITNADKVRGAYTAARSWWDVLYYDVNVNLNIAEQTISGKVVISCKALQKSNTIQIDLQEPMAIDIITLSTGEGKQEAFGQVQTFKRVEQAYTFEVPSYFEIKPNQKFKIYIHYHGKPTKATRPPWDGGIIFSKSKDGSPWVSLACQGFGASFWYPCKDHQADEPDNGAALTVAVPDSLMVVANGRLAKDTVVEKTRIVTWKVTNPINTYNLVPYIGKYVHFKEIYAGESGPLTLDYWVLQENEEKAKKHFLEVPRTIKAFEYWFGPYPFFTDGYKLVEAPHLGMEHQSAVAYGNKYKNGYLGSDISGSKNKWGLKWDFIIVHESGHEWFGNSITSKDIADMWVHEGFTSYSETLFTDYYFGKQAGNEYQLGKRQQIQNDIPIIGVYEANKEGSGDMYNKGSSILHTIRYIVNNDAKFRAILRGINKTFYHQTVTTKQIEQYLSKNVGVDLSSFFNQYLRTTQLPILEVSKTKFGVTFKYTNCIKGFNLPLRLTNGTLIKPTTVAQTQAIPIADFTIDPNFYITVQVK